MTAADWEVLARQSFNEAADGRPAPSYDRKIAKALSQIDISKRIPDMWAYYDALSSVPLLILRGENTDLLPATTFEEMKRRHPNATALTIPAQGHPVLFLDRFSIGEAGRFLRDSDPPCETFRPIPYEMYPAA